MKLLVVSPHPDDETLGAGGTVLKYKSQGHQIYWLNFTDMSKEVGFTDEQMAKRKTEIEEVCKLYNFDGFYNLELNTTLLDTYRKTDLIQRISKIIQTIEPNIVILPYYQDVHSDHKIVFDIVFSCTKVFRYPYIKKILMMEILSETDFSIYNEGFLPNYFVDVSDFFEKKIEIMEIYKSELGESPFPRSIENIKALGRFRGASAGSLFAEAFILLKGIE